MSENEVQSCTMCSFCATQSSQLLNHVYTIHRHDPNFHVYCCYCMRSYKKLSAYRKHVSRGCKEYLPQQIREEEHLPLTVEDDRESDDDDHDSGEIISQQWHEARFILSIKERHVLSQAAVDQILSSTTTLVSSLLDNITFGLGSINQEVVTLVEERVDQAKTMFLGLSTEYMQQKYFSKNFQLVVS